MYKVVHIASHCGNVGDILNHNGFYQHILSRLEIPDIDITRIEIRDFYNNAKHRKQFNKDFADYLNQFDLVILGGGGFFDVQWPLSATGTTMDMGQEFIDRVKTKVLVNAMGYHEYSGKYENDIYERFYNFLLAAEKNNWMISFRNDGSSSRLFRRFAKSLPKSLYFVPDNAFYNKAIFEENETIIGKAGIPIVGMCITNDLFCEAYNRGVTEEGFNKYLSRIISDLCENGYHVKLLPHIPSDIDIISKLFCYIDGENKRKHISVGSLDCNTENAILRLLSNYSCCDCVVGMRFHSLIASIDSGIPTIALSGHEQIEGLFEELGLKDDCIVVNNYEFAEEMISKINYAIDNVSIYRRKYEKIFSEINIKKEYYLQGIKKFLNK